MAAEGPSGWFPVCSIKTTHRSFERDSASLLMHRRFHADSMFITRTGFEFMAGRISPDAVARPQVKHTTTEFQPRHPWEDNDNPHH
jgi:hypothetical protein